MHSSYVVTDPKGSVVCEVGKLLERNNYKIKIFNTINFKKSMHYNPFAYIHSEKDILKLVTTLITNTKGDGKSGDEFWTKAETLLYCALIGYIHYEAPPEEQNFTTLLEFINAMEARRELAVLQSRKNQFEKSLQDLYEKLIDGTIDKDTYLSQKASNQTQMQELTEKMERLEKSSQTTTEQGGAFIEKYKEYTELETLPLPLRSDKNTGFVETGAVG